MSQKSPTKKISLLVAGCLVVLAGACRPGADPTAFPGPAATETQAALVTPSIEQPTATPSPTPEPAAVIVNEGRISLVEFEAEMQRLNAAAAEVWTDASEDEKRQQVINSFIDELLLAEGAAQAGFSVSEELLQQHLATLEASGLAAWMEQNHYTGEQFQAALSRSLAAAWQRDQIIAEVPEQMEQVHALQILVLDETTANDIFRQLQGGRPFADLAVQYDPVIGGDLGWFPQGFLTVPQLNEAVFALQPGEYSQVIHTDFGYHLLYVIERGVSELQPDARRVLQRQALQNWLEQRRTSSAITIAVP